MVDVTSDVGNETKQFLKNKDFKNSYWGFQHRITNFLISSIFNMVESDDYFSLRFKISFLLLSTDDLFLSLLIEKWSLQIDGILV